MAAATAGLFAVTGGAGIGRAGAAGEFGSVGDAGWAGDAAPFFACSAISWLSKAASCVSFVEELF
jgi:hypothetical protein